MIKKTETYICDVCKKNIETKNHSYSKLDIIFTTEQTEGRGVEPYLTEVHNIDLCSKCNTNLLEGNYIFGRGAQGYNTYYFRNIGEQSTDTIHDTYLDEVLDKMINTICDDDEEERKYVKEMLYRQFSQPGAKEKFINDLNVGVKNGISIDKQIEIGITLAKNGSFK